MDENQERLNRYMQGMSPEIRHLMQRFTRQAAESNACALSLIRQLEAGRMASTDALDALNTCQAARH